MKTGRARDKGHAGSQVDDGFRAEIDDVWAQVLLAARVHDSRSPGARVTGHW